MKEINKDRDHPKIFKGWSQKKLNPLFEKAKVFTAGLNHGGTSLEDLVVALNEQAKINDKKKDEHTLMVVLFFSEKDIYSKKMKKKKKII